MLTKDHLLHTPHPAMPGERLAYSTEISVDGTPALDRFRKPGVAIADLLDRHGRGSMEHMVYKPVKSTFIAERDTGGFGFTRKGVVALQGMIPGLIHAVRHNPIIQFTPALLELMHDADIDASITANYFRSPTQGGVYLHLGNAPGVGDTIEEAFNENSGKGALVGVYLFPVTEFSTAVEKHYLERYGKPPLRQIDCVWVIGARREDGEYGVGMVFSSIEILSEDETIVEIVKRTGLGYADSILISDREGVEKPDMSESVDLVAKLLLYTNVAQVRRSEHPEYSEMVQNAKQKKGPKQKKELRRADRKWDYILIGPPETDVAALHGSTGKTVSAHYRRGHFRLQPYGPKRAFRRLIFVAPMVVNAKSLDEGAAVHAKDYIAQ